MVYRGGLSERAGTWVLLEAMKLLAERGRNARLLLIGYCDDGEVERALRERVAKLGLAAQVEIMGRIRHSEMAQALGRARIGICPLQDTAKFRVNIPVKVFEYWACGLPVIASDLPPIRPFFKNVHGGILFPPDDAAELAQAMEWLLAHPTTAVRMGEQRADCGGRAIQSPARGAEAGEIFRADCGDGLSDDECSEARKRPSQRFNTEDTEKGGVHRENVRQRTRPQRMQHRSFTAQAAASEQGQTEDHAHARADHEG